MGVFIDFYGENRIPEDLGAELAERMKTLFIEGGMMTFDRIYWRDREISLLRPPEYEMGPRYHLWSGDDEKEEYICFGYNYFEDDRHEEAGYNASRQSLFSGKVGSSIFLWIMHAAYILRELYSDVFGITAVNGVVRNAEPAIGWLNHLFDEEYTNERMRSLWEIYKILPDDAREHDLFCVAGHSAEFRSLRDMLVYLCISDFEKYKECIAEAGKEGVESIDPHNVPMWVWVDALNNSLTRIKESAEKTDQEKLDELKRLMQAPRQETEEPVEGVWSHYQSFEVAASLIPFEITLKYIAETFETDFWMLYEEMFPVLQGQTPPYPVNDVRKDAPPIEKRTIREFIGVKDDDRVPFWKPDGAVVFSEEMNAWLEEMKGRLDELIAGDGELIAEGEFFSVFIDTLFALEESYIRMYFFSNAFQEFVSTSYRREIQAAVLLMQKMMEEDAEEIEELSHARWYTDIRTPGRMRMRRYLAVLANRELRQKVFGF